MKNKTKAKCSKCGHNVEEHGLRGCLSELSRHEGNYMCSCREPNSRLKAELPQPMETYKKERKKWSARQKWYVDENGKRRRIGSWGRIKNPSVRGWVRNKEQDILAGVEKNEGRKGHVYVFSIGAGLYKIGRTTNVSRRLKSLRASNPIMRCVLSAWVKDMYKAEKQIHKSYKKYRIDREIFQLTTKQIKGLNNLFDRIKEDY